MKGMHCEVIEDLLPIYVEDMASDATKALVKKHLTSCEACRKKEENMRGEVELPLNTDVTVLKKISDKLYHKKVTAIVLTVLTMLVISIIVISNLHAPIRLAYEEVADSIHIQVNEQGEVVFLTNHPDGAVKIEYGIGEDGIGNAQISCYTTKWMQLFGGGDYEQRIPLNNPYVEGGTVEKVYYSPASDGSAVCIYLAEGIRESSGGYMELPRLVLNYYLFLAVILTIVGIIVCLVLHKNKKAFPIALKITVVPAMYFLSSILILSGARDVYNAAYYFTGILLVTILLSLMCWWLIAYVRRKRRNGLPG